jgi:hypothetical protein
VNLESISIATYICDFGNVVVGSTKRKSFRLTNVGRIPVTFNFDKKLLTQAGIAIDPDKVQKVMPNASMLSTWCLQQEKMPSLASSDTWYRSTSRVVHPT